MRRLASVVVSLGLAFGSFGAKTPEEHWQQTFFPGEILSRIFTRTTCYSSERQFMACFQGINAVLAYAPGKQTLYPSSLVKAEDEVQVGFGPFKVVKLKAVPAKTKTEYLKKMRAEREKITGELTRLYQETKDAPFRFEMATAWLGLQPFFREKSSFLASEAVNGYYGVIFDPHTRILPISQYTEEFDESQENLTGIGVNLAEKTIAARSVTFIDSTFEGSPAEAAGLQGGDEIVAINGEPCQNESINSIAKRLTGLVGETVRVQVRRGSEVLEFAIVRRQLVIANVTVKLLPNNGVPVGYLKLRSFMYESACDQLRQGIQKLSKEGAEAFILDLRENGGGVIGHARCIANLFLDKDKTVVETRSLKDEKSVMTLKTNQDAETDLPLVTLIDSNSASASEIVSGALQDHGRSLLVGERTFGKATAQGHVEMPPYPLILRQTQSRFYLPSGRTNQLVGVMPDFEVYSTPNPSEDDKVEFREEDLYMALPAVGEPWKQPRPEYIKKISTCLDKLGVSKKRYAEQANQLARADYQLLYGQDVATCALSVGGS